MNDSFYPTIDIAFIEQRILHSGKVIADSKVHVGSTTTFILTGSQAIHKRHIFIREIAPGQISYEQATGLAIRLSFIGSLITWMETNRHWKEGAYIVPQDLSE